MKYRNTRTGFYFEIDLEFTSRLKCSVFGTWVNGPREGKRDAIMLSELVAEFEPANTLLEVA